jgi:hypothetical protein
MKRAEVLLGYMDRLKNFIELIRTYVDRGMEYLQIAREWIDKILDYLQKGVDALVENMGGRGDNQIGDDYLFV